MKALVLAVTASWRASPGACALTSVEVLARVLGILPPVPVGVLVTALSHADVPAAVAAAAAIVTCIGAVEGLSTVGVHARVRLREKVGFVFDRRVAALLAQIPTLEHRSDPDVAEKVRLLTEEAGSLGNAVNRLLNVALNGVYIVGSVAVAVSASAWMVIPLLMSGMTLLLTPLIARAERMGEVTSAPGSLARERLLDTGSSWTDLWDARLHGGLGLLRRRFDEAVDSWTTPRRAAQRKIALLSGIDQLLFLAGAGVALLLTAQDAVSGRASAGSLAQAFIVVTTLGSLSAVGQFTLSLAARSLRSMNRVLWLQGYVELHTRLPVAERQPGSSAVRLASASYTYPGAVAPALYPTTLDIPAGAFVVIVGENGSGKSTLVDLILGVRSPTTGTVVVAGRDAVAHSASTVAQGFMRYELRLRDAVGFGDTDLLDNDAALSAAAREAAASGVTGAHGWDVQLGEQWRDGVGLSGGQWQRVATARGLVGAHRVVVLDEPASALDALAEAKLIATLRERARRDGSITHIVVTHRLDAARSADLVVVLNNGRAVEIGSPAALVAANGHYANLWRLHCELTG